MTNTTSFLNNVGSGGFRRGLEDEFSQFLKKESLRYPAEDTLRIDLHCHDHNSDTPDELWGRILGLPETWLKTGKLVKCLERNGSDVITITNHNNARSCWSLLEKGYDVLVGTEFTCYFEEEGIYLHVLTYGFTPQQEEILLEKRHNVYDFLRYAADQDLPTVLPHPLYFYAENDRFNLAFFEKLALLFQRFEVLNGQRDLWQSTLTLNWVKSLTPEKIAQYARKHGLNPRDFGVDPDAPKILTGGSDDHMGIFAGQCGTQLYVPNLKEKLQHTSASQLALEAIRRGNTAPYGQVADSQKLNIALLDYFSQISTRMEDPGLLRLFLHRGETKDKLACFAIGNVLLELQKNKTSRKFFEYVHDALQGKKPSKLLTWKVPKRYRFFVSHLERIADSHKHSPEAFVEEVNSSIGALFKALNELIFERVSQSELVTAFNPQSRFSLEELARNVEIPSQLSRLRETSKKGAQSESAAQLQQLMGQISFPALIASVLAGASLASTRVLYKNREFLNDFADHIDCNRHAHRALHLSDTFFDNNGVSHCLQEQHRYFADHDSPVDFLICHETAEAAEHLHVVRPVGEVTVPNSGGQKLRVPDLLEVARIFQEGGYDRLICSTEGPMGLVALFLRYMFNVPSYAFMHTDWIEYVRSNTSASKHECDRLRRILRLYYKQFEGVFVLNHQHRDWLIGHEMELESDAVMLTAHAAPHYPVPVVPVEKSSLFKDAGDETPVMLVASRLSAEKGLLVLPEVYAKVKEKIPDIRLVIAGSGPIEPELKALLPEATFTGWLEKPELASLYAGLDLLLLPSRFDTFGNVLLEGLTCGMPAVAYDCKGPRDILADESCGYLVDDAAGMADAIVRHFSWPDQRAQMKKAALLRAEQYAAEDVMADFLAKLGLSQDSGRIDSLSAA